MTILQTITEKVNKLKPNKATMLKEVLNNYIFEIIIISIGGSFLFNLLSVSIMSILDSVNYFNMRFSTMPDFIHPLKTAPILLTISSICCFSFFYKIIKKDKQKEMYILSEDELIGFIKEYNEQVFQDEIINHFQKQIKVNGSINYNNLVSIHNIIKEKRNKLLCEQSNVKREKASICFGEKVREELKIKERIKDCV